MQTKLVKETIELLIVPEGIEIDKLLFLMSRINTLLIVPEGIEMTFLLR